MTTPHRARLLDVDPDLGRLLPSDRLAEAQRDLLCRMHVVERGPWAAERLRTAGPEHIGLLLASGVVAREIALEDTVSAELLGPGDLVRPWQAEQASELMRATVRWVVVDEARFAVLDRHVAVMLTRYPEVTAMLIDRLSERAQQLAMTQAISQLNGVERRLLALFWHMSERWGRVVREGIVVPVALPHRMIAQLVGARRPTISTALGNLAQRGQLVRRHDGSWLLTGEPVGVPTDEAARVIRSRRRRFAPAGTVGNGAEQAPPQGGGGAEPRIADLSAELDALKERHRRHREDFEAISERTTELHEQLTAARARRSAASRRPEDGN